MDNLEKKYRKIYNLKTELHELMKTIIFRTGLGCIEEEGIDSAGPESLNLDFGGGGLYSCIYYEQVRFCDSKGIEHEFDNDLESIKRLLSEIKKRYALLEKETAGNKIKTDEIFNKHFKL